MGFGQGKDPLDILRVGDCLFDVVEGQQLLSDDLAEAFGDLLLSFGEDAVEGETQDLFGQAGVEEHF